MGNKISRHEQFYGVNLTVYELISSLYDKVEMAEGDKYIHSAKHTAHCLANKFIMEGTFDEVKKNVLETIKRMDYNINIDGNKYCVLSYAEPNNDTDAPCTYLCKEYMSRCENLERTDEILEKTILDEDFYIMLCSCHCNILNADILKHQKDTLDVFDVLLKGKPVKYYDVITYTWYEYTDKYSERLYRLTSCH